MYCNFRDNVFNVYIVKLYYYIDTPFIQLHSLNVVISPNYLQIYLKFQFKIGGGVWQMLTSLGGVVEGRQLLTGGGVLKITKNLLT